MQGRAGGQHLNHRRPTMDWVKEVMSLFSGVGLVGVAVVDLVALVMGPSRGGWPHSAQWPCTGGTVSGGIMGSLGCFILLVKYFLARIFSFLHACSSSLATS